MAQKKKQDLTDLVRERAYELYSSRGYADGYHEQDWIQAESELVGESKPPKAKRKKKVVGD